MAVSQQPEIQTARDQLYRMSLLVRRSLRHLGVGMIVMALGLVASVGLALIKKRYYLSEAVVLYRQIIRSSYLAGPESQVEAAQSDVGLRLRELLLARPQLEQIIRKHRLYPAVVERRGYIEAVNELRQAIDYRVGGGDTFHISFKGPTPALAQAVTQDLADAMIAQELKLRSEQVNATLKFVESETKRLQIELQQRERALAEFLAEHPEFAQEQVAGQTMANAGASVRAAQVRRAAARRGDDVLMALRRQAERIKSQLEQGTRVIKMPPDPELVAAKEAAEQQLQEEQGLLLQTQAQFTEKHPDVLAAKARVRAAAARLDRVRQAVASSGSVRRQATSVDRDKLQSDLDNINRQVSAITARAGSSAKGSVGNRETDSRASSIVALETDWTSLNREVNEARERYLRLEERQFRASIESNSEVTGQASQMRIVDPPYEPSRPAGVGRTVIVAGGGLVSFVLALVVVLGLGWIDERVYDRLDVERLNLVDVLVEVPGVAVATKLAVGQPPAEKRSHKRSV